MDISFLGERWVTQEVLDMFWMAVDTDAVWLEIWFNDEYVDVYPVHPHDAPDTWMWN